MALDSTCLCQTHIACEVLAQLLLEMGIECVSLNSYKDQRRRLAALGKFRSGVVKVMVATDIASRGLDIPTVKLVVRKSRLHDAKTES